jgi:hypothetical protein
MKKLLVLLMVLLFATLGIADQLTFVWDPNDPAPEGYRLFQRLEGEEYSNHFWQGQETTATTDVNGVAGQKTDYYFVVRAYEGDTESLDSNEVKHTVDLVPPVTASDVIASYEASTSEITLSWKQSGLEEIIYWKVYYAEDAGGPYSEIETVLNIGQSEIFATRVLEVPLGSMQTFYFTIVSFKRDSLYSLNSEEVFVTVDNRISTEPVQNFKITVIVK